jgi:hypothetical protein
MNRRHLLATLPLLALTACPGTTTPVLTQIKTDVSNTITGLQAAVAALSVAGSGIPALTLGTIQMWLGNAQTAATTILAAITPDAGTVTSFAEAVNSLIAAAQAIPGLPPQVLAILAAAGVLLPVIESEIPGVASLSPLSVPSPAKADAARATLKAAVS